MDNLQNRLNEFALVQLEIEIYNKFQLRLKGELNIEQENQLGRTVTFYNELLKNKDSLDIEIESLNNGLENTTLYKLFGHSLKYFTVNSNRALDLLGEAPDDDEKTYNEFKNAIEFTISNWIETTELLCNVENYHIINSYEVPYNLLVELTSILLGSNDINKVANTEENYIVLESGPTCSVYIYPATNNKTALSPPYNVGINTVAINKLEEIYANSVDIDEERWRSYFGSLPYLPRYCKSRHDKKIGENLYYKIRSHLDTLDSDSYIEAIDYLLEDRFKQVIYSNYRKELSKDRAAFIELQNKVDVPKKELPF